MINCTKILSGILGAVILICSCKKFSELNTDPNNITYADASPDYLMANVMTQTAMDYGNLGSGNMSGAMQQTYQDAFGATYSAYYWGQVDWSANYSRLRDNKLMLGKAKSLGWRFHQGVGLIMRAFNFGMIADFWGDAPDSMALQGDQDGTEYQFPAFDKQEAIYDRVIADLKQAIPLLAGTQAEHAEITPVTISSDPIYAGDPAAWTKLAYSLLLRYYMRLSSKRNVQSEVESVAQYVFAGNEDDCTMKFPGTDASTSYQKASAYQGPSNFNRNKMCATFVKKLDALKDPRIVIMAEPIVTPSSVDAGKFDPGDDSTLTLPPQNGIRYINPLAAAKKKFKEFDINTYSTDRPYGAPVASIWSFFDSSPKYVGIPISYSNSDFGYNINGAGTQTNSNNDYVSYLRRDIYDNPKGELLKQRLASYNEICFDLAEAALNGWNVGGSASDWYIKGIKSSFALWEVFSNYQTDVNNYAGCVKDYNTYIAQPLVQFDGSLQRIIEQKWIASWQASCESFMDWRRTGFPSIQVGWGSLRAAVPVRFAYANSELSNNLANADIAIKNLEPSAYNGPDGNNSSWSKFWLLQGTGKPW
ncbi:MAG: SusD/RagB family nutrient-binding outer membrane lipoprotein [Chitinophagales bacterium]